MDTINKNVSTIKTQKLFKVHWFNIPQQIDLNNLKTGLSQCSTPCTYTTAGASDIVIFDGDTLPRNPPFKKSNPNQIWVFHEMESPPITASKSWRGESWRNQFNRTMSYRMDSDVFVPYGSYNKRVKPLKKNMTAIMKQKTKLAVIFSSHCGTPSKRELFINLLRKYITVDFYGRCGNLTCKKSTKTHKSCFDTVEKTYKFYFAFENTFCKDYATEKFYRSEAQDLVTVVRGGADYSKLSPEKNYIDTKDFNSVKELATYLKYLDKNETAYTEILERKWKYNVNHAEFAFTDMEKISQKQAICDLCSKAGSWVKETKVYENIASWYEKDICHAPTDIH
ncbi:alpha-(1,3)-fucosyltransferase C [Patella vulgata]|uniref:alpha-(1,3)-fucosyltransferase C n=1 Tax=Patella vulgata TaxID=6465 RepID=UPI00217F353F|nr:alpha-(1,3)-fucosyltransferase C [Patella vulgata]